MSHGHSHGSGLCPRDGTIVTTSTSQLRLQGTSPVDRAFECLTCIRGMMVRICLQGAAAAAAVRAGAEASEEVSPRFKTTILMNLKVTIVHPATADWFPPLNRLIAENNHRHELLSLLGSTILYSASLRNQDNRVCALLAQLEACPDIDVHQCSRCKRLPPTYPTLESGARKW